MHFSSTYTHYDAEDGFHTHVTEWMRRYLRVWFSICKGGCGCIFSLLNSYKHLCSGSDVFFHFVIWVLKVLNKNVLMELSYPQMFLC